MSPHARFFPASVAIVLAAGASLFLLSAAQADLRAATETHFLAIWSTAVLLCAAGLTARPSLELAGSSLLLVLAGWVVPAGPVRGATFGALLVASLGLALHRHITQEKQGLGWSLLVPAALGAQFLARSDRFLTGLLEPRTLFGLVVLPLVAAWALGMLGWRRGFGPTLLIGGVCLMLVPGWSVAVVLSLLGVALGTVAVARKANRWIRLGGLAILVVTAYTWHPGLAAIILLTTLLVASGESRLGAAIVALAAVIALAIMPGVRAWEESLLQTGLLLVLIPAAPLVGSRDSRRVMAAALLLTLLAARTVPLPGALASPLAVVVLCLPSEGTYVTLQRIWTGTLVSGTLLLAAYPWLRDEPLAHTLGFFGVRGAWSSVLGVLIAFLLLGWLVEIARSRMPRAQLPAGIALAALSAAVFIQLPIAGVDPLAGTPVVLTEESDTLTTELPPDVRVGSVVLDSYLENSASLPMGTPVAEVRLEMEDGDHLLWLVRAGVESGEWAARRGDVATLPGFQAPSPWLTWIPAGDEFFGQRYRSRWELPAAQEPTRLMIQRKQELPPELGLAVLSMELRP